MSFVFLPHSLSLVLYSIFALFLLNGFLLEPLVNSTFRQA